MRVRGRLSARLFAGLIRRETRGSRRRFAFFMICLAIGVAAIVCVAGLTDNLDRRIRREARHLLAADLMVAGLQPLTTEIESFLASRPELAVTRIKELVTVAVRADDRASPGKSQLIELKVIDGEYPFYGRLETEPPEVLAKLLDNDGTVVAPDLLVRLGLVVGDSLRIGGEDFEITAELLAEPDRVASPFSLGPRVLVGATGFQRTTLEQHGSRIVYRALIRAPAGATSAQLEELAAELEAIIGQAGRFRVETYTETQEELQRSLRRAAAFLGLVALLSLLLGGLGIAQTTRAWLASRMDDIAILRCLGLRPLDVVGLFLAQTAVLAFVGSLVGVGLGALVQSLLPIFFGEILGNDPMRLWQPLVFLRGLGLGLGVALIFSARALLSVRSIPPLRVLRKDVEPLPSSRRLDTGVLAILAVGIWAVASVQAMSLLHGALFTAGLAVATAVLAGVATAIMRALAPVARRLHSLPVRHGLLALARPGAATLAAVVSLGIGVLLILGLQLVESRLTDQLRNEIPADSPTAFLVNIQPAQWTDVEAVLASGQALNVESVPFVTARLRAIDGRSITDLEEDLENGDRKWALTREQRLTYMQELPADNRIVAGELWSDPSNPEVSVEEGFARDLDVGIGARLLFDVQGIPIELQVSSIRTVEWTTFGINFFLVVEPGVLDHAPYQRVATMTLPRAREQQIQDELAHRFPNITLLKIREILEKIVAVLGFLARGVGFIGAFTAVAGVLILAGGVSADSVRRRRQIALLKTLGLTQGDIALMLATEFAVIGLVTGLIGIVGGSLLSWAVVTHGLELDWRPAPVTLLVALVLTLTLTTATGILTSRRAMRQPPAAVLRGD